MKRPTFIHGAGLAFVLSFCGAALFATALPFIAGGGAFRLLVTLVAAAYVLYLLSRSDVRVGRFAVGALWFLAAGALWFTGMSLPLFLIAHVALIWLLRSLYFHSSIVPALMDLGLSGVALAAAIWAALQSGSMFLGLWCFFLVQALFVAIPRSIKKRSNNDSPEHHADTTFQRAHRDAEAALRKLSANP